MLGTKNAIICDRRVYAYKGKWINPQNDIEENIYYFISQPMTLNPSWENGREELKQTIQITIFGEHAFCEKDIIKLQNGETFKVVGITNNYLESHLLVRDMLKQRIESQVLVLE